MTNSLCLSAPFHSRRLLAVVSKKQEWRTCAWLGGVELHRQSISCLSTAGQFSSRQKENNIRTTAPLPNHGPSPLPPTPRSLTATEQPTSLIASFPPSNTNLKKPSFSNRPQPWMSTPPWAWSRWTLHWGLRGLAQRGFLSNALETLLRVLIFDRILCCNCGSPIDGTVSAGALCFDW